MASQLRALTVHQVSCENCTAYAGCTGTDMASNPAWITSYFDKVYPDDIYQPPACGTEFDDAVNGSTATWDQVVCSTQYLSDVGLNILLPGLTLVDSMSKETSWDSARLKQTLDSLMSTNEVTINTAIDKFKQDYCDAASIQDGKHMVRNLMGAWFNKVFVDLSCPEETTEISAGTYYYNRLNRIPKLIMGPTYGSDESLSPSMCLNDCNTLKPMNYDPNVVGGSSTIPCCGSFGYVCKAWEGSCSMNEHCEPGNECDPQGCPWAAPVGGMSCCVPQTSKGALYQLRATSTLAAYIVSRESLLNVQP